ncbi:MAG: sulfotransferase [Candidatus Omnitrophota bacterium]
MAMDDHDRLMDHLTGLPICALLTTGRTGTDLLQSLLDFHPDVLTFNGSLFFHTFWKDSVCVNAGRFEPGDLLDEFIGRHIEKLKSRYDIQEGKDKLGDGLDQSLDIDTARFKSEAMGLLQGREINSRNFMLAVYGAYAACLGQDIMRKKILFHHLHHIEKLDDYLRDFPDSSIISMTRDPRANFVSGIEHWRRYRPSTDQGAHLYYYIKRILEDASPLGARKNRYAVLRIEDLGDDRVLRKMCDWLGIAYDECIRRSTWGGLTWHGDRLSANRKEGAGWSGGMLKNNWEHRLSAADKSVFNYIMHYRLRHYGYVHKDISLADSIAMPFLILLPLSYELRFFSLGYVSACLRQREYRRIWLNFLFYLRRVSLFFRYYSMVVRKIKFNQPFLSCSREG